MAASEFIDVLLLSLTETSSQQFSARLAASSTASSEGLVVDEFVDLFADIFYNNADAELRAKLDEVDEDGKAMHYARMKATLFTMFKQMDLNEDGYVSWSDVTSFCVEERVTATRKELTDHIPFYVHSHSWRYQPLSSSTQRPPAANNIARDMKELCERVTKRRDAAIRDSENRTASPELDEDVHDKVLDALEQKSLAVDPLRNLFHFNEWGRVVGVSQSRDAYILDQYTLKVVARLPPVGSTARAATYLASPEAGAGPMLVTTHRDCSVHAWGIRDKAHCDLHHEYMHGCDVVQSCIAANPGVPTSLYSGGVNGSIRRWCFSTALFSALRRGSPTALQTISSKEWAAGEFHTDAVTQMLFLDNGSTLVSSSLDGSVCFHDVEHESKSRTLSHRRGIFSMAHCEPFHLLCCAGYDFMPSVWDASSRTNVAAKLDDVQDPHRNAIISLQCVENSPLLLSCDTSGKVKLWDLRTMKGLQTIHTEATGRGTLTTGSAHISTTSMIHVPSSNAVYVTGRHLHQITTLEKANPTLCHSTDVVAVGFDERNGTIITAHSEAIVVWDASLGKIVSRFPLEPSPVVSSRNAVDRRGSSTKAGSPHKQQQQQQPETIVAFCMAAKGGKYCIGTSYGNVSVHKSSTGDCIQRSNGPQHDAEVSFLVYGDPPNDLYFVLSLGRDGTCSVLSESSKLPRHFSISSNGVPTCGAYNAPLATILLGTQDAKFLTLDIGTVNSRGPLTRDELPSKGDAVALCFIESMFLTALSEGNGFITFWGVRPFPILGKELARVTLPSTPTHSNVIATALVNCSLSSTQVVVAGDELGRLTVFTVTDGIGGRTKARKEAVRQHATFSAHSDAIQQVSYCRYADSVMSVGYDKRVMISVMKCDADGEITIETIGSLCQGRGLRNVRWPGGEPPAYEFPDVSSYIAAERLRAGRTIRLIQNFLNKLRDKVRSRKERTRKASQAVMRREAFQFNDSSSGGLLSDRDGAAQSHDFSTEFSSPFPTLQVTTDECGEPQLNSDGITTSLSHQSFGSNGHLGSGTNASFGRRVRNASFDGRRQNTLSLRMAAYSPAASPAMGDLEMPVREESSSSFEGSGRGFILSPKNQKKVARHGNTHQQKLVNFCPTPPSQSPRVKLVSGNAHMHAKAIDLESLASTTSSDIDRRHRRRHTIGAVHSRAQRTMKRAEAASLHTLGVKERMSRHVGHLITLSATNTSTQAKEAECSSRAVLDLVKKKYHDEEIGLVRRRALEMDEIKLRHAVGKADRDQHAKIQVELATLRKNELEAKRIRDEIRAKLLAGPKLPPEPDCRRAPDRHSRPPRPEDAFTGIMPM